MEESKSEKYNKIGRENESIRSSTKEQEKDEDLSVTKDETPFVIL